jgi:tetratricopeptide (TPR) repeat protein
VKAFDKSLEYPLDPVLAAGASFWSGEAYSIGRRYPQAIESYEKVLKVPGASATEFGYKTEYGLGYAYYNSKNYEAALPHFKKYTESVRFQENRQNYNDALLRLADSYFATKNYNDALANYNRVIASASPDVDYAYFQKGLVLSIMNRPDEAKASFDVVITKFRESRVYDDALYQKANVDFENGNYAPAISGFTLVINSKNKTGIYPYALQKRALANYNIQKFNESINDYKIILKDFASHPIANSALLGIKEALTAVGKPEEFSTYLTSYKTSNPDSKAIESIEFDAASTLYFSEKYPQAIAALKEFLNAYPASGKITDAKYYIAESYYRSNDLNSALPYYVELLGQPAGAYKNKSLQRAAEIEFKTADYPSAISYYRSLLAAAASKKDQFYAWTGLMESFFESGNNDSTRFYADAIINHGSATVNSVNKAYLFRAKSWYAKGDLDKALDDFIETVNAATDENGAQAKYRIAEIQMKKQNYRQSLETLFELTSTFSAYKQWYNKAFLLMADNYASLGEYFQAKETLKSVIEKSGDQPVIDLAKEKLKKIEEQEAANEKK